MSKEQFDIDINNIIDKLLGYDNNQELIKLFIKVISNIEELDLKYEIARNLSEMFNNQSKDFDLFLKNFFISLLNQDPTTLKDTEELKTILGSTEISGHKQSCGSYSLGVVFATLFTQFELKDKNLLQTTPYQMLFDNLQKHCNPKPESWDDLHKILVNMGGKQGTTSLEVQYYLNTAIRNYTKDLMLQHEHFYNSFKMRLDLYLNDSNPENSSILIYEYGLTPQDRKELDQKKLQNQTLSEDEKRKLFEKAVNQLSDPNKEIEYSADILYAVARSLGYTVCNYSKESDANNNYVVNINPVLNPVAIIQWENDNSRGHWHLKGLLTDLRHSEISKDIADFLPDINEISKELISVGYPILLAQNITKDPAVLSEILNKHPELDRDKLTFEHYQDFLISNYNLPTLMLKEYKIENILDLTSNDVTKDFVVNFKNIFPNNDFLEICDDVYSNIPSELFSPQQKLFLLALVQFANNHGITDLSAENNLSIIEKLYTPASRDEIDAICQNLFNMLKPEIQDEIYLNSLDYVPANRVKSLSTNVQPSIEAPGKDDSTKNKTRLK